LVAVAAGPVNHQEMVLEILVVLVVALVAFFLELKLAVLERQGKVMQGVLQVQLAVRHLLVVVELVLLVQIVQLCYQALVVRVYLRLLRVRLLLTLAVAVAVHI
jgi:hypothetical protein